MDKTKLYDELRQQYYKMLDQKEEHVRGPLYQQCIYWLTHTTPTQVQSVEDTAGKTEKENEGEKQTQADEHRIEEKEKEKKEEDITDGVPVEDGEKSNKDWG